MSPACSCTDLDILWETFGAQTCKNLISELVSLKQKMKTHTVISLYPEISTVSK